MTDLFDQYQHEFTRHITQAGRQLRGLASFQGDAKRMEISSIERELEKAREALEKMQREASYALSNRGRLESAIQQSRKELQEYTASLAQAKNPGAAPSGGASGSSFRPGTYGSTFDPEARTQELSDRMRRVDETTGRINDRLLHAEQTSEENRAIGHEIVTVLEGDKQKLIRALHGTDDIRDNMSVSRQIVGQMTWRLYQYKAILIIVNLLLLGAMGLLLYFLITK